MFEENNHILMILIKLITKKKTEINNNNMKINKINLKLIKLLEENNQKI